MTNTMKTNEKPANYSSSGHTKAKTNTSKVSKKRKAMTTQEYEEMLMEFIKSEFEECI